MSEKKEKHWIGALNLILIVSCATIIYLMWGYIQRTNTLTYSQMKILFILLVMMLFVLTLIYGFLFQKRWKTK
ncbi:MAG: hypothetical protein DRJ47_05620 [Thermoprotei archaeon]|nr:MAG: hypothetical protein DRJ47_05620 [Thermoprotei archaeon]